MGEDVFEWARQFDDWHHECGWVQHPTEDEIREAGEKLVWKRIWWMPCCKRQCIIHVVQPVIRPYEQCAICDAIKPRGPGLRTSAPTFGGGMEMIDQTARAFYDENGRWPRGNELAAATHAVNEVQMAAATFVSPDYQHDPNYNPQVEERERVDALVEATKHATIGEREKERVR